LTRDVVEELVRKMTIEEKIAQLTSIFVDDLVEGDEFSEVKAEKVLRYGIGQITRVAGSKLGFKPKQVARIINKIQKFLVEKTRLGIPAIVHEECLAGLMGPSVIMFPIPLALASTWSPDLVKHVAEAIRAQVLTVGVKHCLSPVLDLCRDPRWGRCEETFGEDPYLVASMGTAYIEGLQGGGEKVEVIATAKHFAAHGVPEGGRNIASVNIGFRELRNTHLYPFEAAVKIARVKAIMPAYHEIDGVPCHANEELLNEILRREWGFDGIVVSDYWGIKFIQTIHKVARSRTEAALLALSSGVDIELPHAEYYLELIDAVKKGEVPESLVDKSVERVLRVKYLLGLFDNPYVDENKVPEIIDNPQFRSIAREVARKSIILLKNNGVLPIPRNIKRIAVVGPLADDPLAMLGDYHYATHIGLLKPDVHIVTALEGIKNKVGSRTTVFFAKGCNLRSTEPKALEEALDLAKEADVVIVVVGDISCIFNREKCTSGEGVDRAELSLTKPQEELVKALKGLGKSIILVVVAGRPMSIESIYADVDAILWCWKLGAEGGNALADVLFGEHSPSGRLPVSIPRAVGQIPVYYSRKPSSFGDYMEFHSKPLYPFGYGLSYTEFKYSSLVVDPKEVPIGGKLKVFVDIENIGDVEGDEVVQLYISRSYSEVALPVKELKAFKRVSLKPKEKRRIVFTISTEQLAYYGKELKLIITPGEYKVMIGRSADDIVVEDRFLVVGESLKFKDRRKFFADSYVE